VTAKRQDGDEDHGRQKGKGEGRGGRRNTQDRRDTPDGKDGKDDDDDDGQTDKLLRCKTPIRGCGTRARGNERGVQVQCYSAGVGDGGAEVVADAQKTRRPKVKRMKTLLLLLLIDNRTIAGRH
jgi:hypothetical protein